MNELWAKTVAGSDRLLAGRLAYEDSARRAHRLNAAALAASAALQRGSAVTQELGALGVAGEGDAVVARALSMVPAAAHSKRGVPSLQALTHRFESSVREAVRVAYMVPEAAPPVIGQAVGTAAAKLVSVAQPVTHAVAADASAGSTSGSSSGSGVSASDLRATVAPSSSPSVPVDASRAPATAAAQERSASFLVKPTLEKAKASAMAALGFASDVVTSVAGGEAGAPSPAAAAVEKAREVKGAAVEKAREVTEKAREVTAPAREAGERLSKLKASAQAATADIAALDRLLESAEGQLLAGDLESAIDTLGRLPAGAPADAARDWIDVARQRVAVERAAALVRARATLVTAAMY